MQFIAPSEKSLLVPEKHYLNIKTFDVAGSKNTEKVVSTKKSVDKKKVKNEVATLKDVLVVKVNAANKYEISENFTIGTGMGNHIHLIKGHFSGTSKSGDKQNKIEFFLTKRGTSGNMIREKTKISSGVGSTRVDVKFSEEHRLAEGTYDILVKCVTFDRMIKDTCNIGLSVHRVN